MECGIEGELLLGILQEGGNDMAILRIMPTWYQSSRTMTLNLRNPSPFYTLHCNLVCKSLVGFTGDRKMSLQVLCHFSRLDGQWYERGFLSCRFLHIVTYFAVNFLS